MQLQQSKILVKAIVQFLSAYVKDSFRFKVVFLTDVLVKVQIQQQSLMALVCLQLLVDNNNRATILTPIVRKVP